MPSKERLQNYARLAIRNGINPKKGQYVLINAPVEAYEFTEMCIKEAYEYGAGYVLVNWNLENHTRMNYEYVETDALKEVPQWMIDKTKWGIDKGICMLHIVADDPNLLDGIDQNKIKEVRMEKMKATQPFQYYSMNNIGQWSIIAYPNVAWAKKVFPELDEKEAFDKLFDAILYTSRVFEGKDAIDEWDKHNKEMHHHAKKMNDYNFKSLHFKNSLGTDLTVGLAKEHIWLGGAEKAANGQVFNANIPTEEVFTMPDRFHIDGTVVSTKPLSYGGKLINEFSLTFKDGVVVKYSAKDNLATLEQLLNTDEGSKSLGEVALISHDSPISNLNILFYDTLFDENASCHLALGACYPITMKNGENMSKEELMAKGGNESMNHVDFMFGSADMSVIGETFAGEKIAVFKDGNFCI